MMKIDRRLLLGGGAAAVALAAAGYAWNAGMLSFETSTVAPGAAGGAVDLSTLNDAPPLGERSLGSADAKVTIIEYASATCPHCATFHKETWPAIKAEFVDTGKARFIFREFPFDDLALAAFMVARCAPEAQYFPIIDILFEQQQAWARSQDPKGALFKVAQLAGFTSESFEACIKNDKIAQGIIDIQQKADKAYGVDSTPSFFINGKMMKGNIAVDDFRKAINDALAG
ncbi:MAG: DsbA family protein [Aestuariivirgaceae bacterium]|nr:DsbA family protein [Aestuariivirgaceae bacterium]